MEQCITQIVMHKHEKKKKENRMTRRKRKSQSRKHTLLFAIILIN